MKPTIIKFKNFPTSEEFEAFQAEDLYHVENAAMLEDKSISIFYIVKAEQFDTVSKAIQMTIETLQKHSNLELAAGVKAFQQAYFNKMN